MPAPARAILARSSRRPGFLLAIACLAGSPMGAQKPTVPAEDYAKFESLGFGPALSPDGRWLAYAVSRVSEENELRIRRLDRDTTIIVPHGTAPRFAASGAWLAWTTGVSPGERARLERDRKPVRTAAGVMHLVTGEQHEHPQVRAHAFDATGRFLALHGYPPESPAGKGADLRIVTLADGSVMSLGNISEFAWSDRGALLALVISTGAAQGNGVQLYDAASGRLRSLDASGSSYRQLAWRKDAADLAALRSVTDTAAAGAPHHLLAWRALDRAEPTRWHLDPATAGVHDTLALVAHAAPRWADDGSRLSIGLRPTDPKTRAPTDSTDKLAQPDTLSTVQIWHSADVRAVPQQKSGATADGRRTLLTVWTPATSRLVQVASDLLESASVTADWRYGLERVAAPYPWGTMFGRRYHDIHVVDLTTGERHLALEQVRHGWESAGGRYLLTFDGTHYWTHDLRTGSARNITERIDAVFTNTEYDTPTDLMPPHGQGGWMKDDAAVLLFDRYDVWRVTPDGARAERLTRGAEERVIHRPVQLDPRATSHDPAAPMYFSLRGERTQESGYARLRPGRAVDRLVWQPKRVVGLARADSAQVYLFRAEGRDDPPDLFIADAALASPRQVTRLNPFHDDYAWTRAELVDFTSETGLPLQGVLLYPANHDPSRRYPMIVYTYEILTTQMHLYQVPSERSYYNFTAWTQHDYFVLLPDVVFRARDPGVSTIEAVRPAIAAVAARGLIDPAKVGHVGHSWGGYQAAFMPTRTDMFAASVAGAPLTDFVSFMGQIHWNPGSPEVDHWETGQARMEVPFWEDPEAHFRNSPIHQAHEMKTPLLMAHGDKDGVVEFFQATTFYNFVRRAGRQMVLLVYEGEDHGFIRKPNQIDYHRRILEWFGHYLKGEPAPTWITEGVRWSAHEAEKRRVAGGPTPPPPPAPRSAQTPDPASPR